MKSLLLFLLTLLSATSAFPAETGWIKFHKNGFVYFRPFVKLKKADKNTKVFFFTPDGKVYKGRKLKNSKKFIPSKKFPDNASEIAYTVLELYPPFSLELIEEGKINQNNVKER